VRFQVPEKSRAFVRGFFHSRFDAARDGGGAERSNDG
jgi:hypothetical protein